MGLFLILLMIRFTLTLILFSLLLVGVTYADTPADREFRNTVRVVLRKYCTSCHNEADKKGGINLDNYDFVVHVVRRGELFRNVIDAVESGNMPPKSSKQLSEDDKEILLAGIDKILSSALAVRDPGKSVMRRLSHREYQYTIKDLLNIDFETVKFFPSEGSGGEGFDNQSGTLFMSPLTMERYYAAADSIVRRIQSDKVLWKNIVNTEYSTGFIRRFVNWVRSVFSRENEIYWEAPVLQAEKFILPFATQAYRRFLSKPEEEKLISFFKQIYFSNWQRRDAFEFALGGVIKSILVSPNFLYRTEANLPLNEAYPVNDFELATRLSYFLWSSMPDESLLETAYREDLQDPDVLKREALRMMADEKFRRFSASFAPQWLGVEELLYSPHTDLEKFPELTPALRKAMHEEVVGFFHQVFTDRRNILELLDCNESWINEELASHYGIKSVDGEEFRMTAVQDPNRGGILGMAAVLTATSLPLRTSPVIRGQWVLDQLLGDPAPPPPADTPPLEDAKNEVVSELDLRALLELHRDAPACRGCHVKMDPIGLGLENFDAIGRWREAYDSIPINSVASLEDGRSFSSPAELKKILVEDKVKFAKNFSRKMLSYALGRRIEFIDTPTLDMLTDDLMQNNFDSHSFMLALITSYPFRHRRSDMADQYKDIM